jgi:hypothetical protein
VKKRIFILALTVSLVFAVVVAASAIEKCFCLSNFGNIYRLELTKFGSYYDIVGDDCVFGPRAQAGAMVPEFGEYTLGFTSHGVQDGATDIHFRAILDKNTLSGPYYGWRDAFGDMISGTMSVCPCTGCSYTEGAPGADAAQ